MYTVKLTDRGKILNFKGKQIRLPTTLSRLSEKDLKLLKVMCKAQAITYEILEQESERLATVIAKAKEAPVKPSDVNDDVEIIVEDLFESEDTMGELLKHLNKE